jgi:hypothetical protein
MSDTPLKATFDCGDRAHLRKLSAYHGYVSSDSDVVPPDFIANSYVAFF